MGGVSKAVDAGQAHQQRDVRPRSMLARPTIYRQHSMPAAVPAVPRQSRSTHVMAIAITDAGKTRKRAKHEVPLHDPLLPLTAQ